ncbi:MAG: cobalamin-dependent protein [Phycisphaeraceae bacterium]|nr:cobalamin-dependent protein [Phycisphaeraceae bacterium]MCW5755118.1 cobalamin-dependent protein [Phycisphaeraceae bacterium]
MDQDLLRERLFEALINGDRPAARAVVQDAAAGLKPAEVVAEVFWPTYELVEKLFRNDQLTRLAHRMATKLLRTLVDQNAARLPLAAGGGQAILAFCGPNDADELGAQMAVDLVESCGNRVRFAGGGIPADEIIAQIHETRPDVVLMFASAPGDLPEIRRMIDQLREIGAVPNLRIVVGGGVFNRAEGLAEEIGAHASASSPFELVELLAKPFAPPARSTRKTRAAA